MLTFRWGYTLSPLSWGAIMVKNPKIFSCFAFVGSILFPHAQFFYYYNSDNKTELRNKSMGYTLATVCVVVYQITKFSFFTFLQLLNPHNSPRARVVFIVTQPEVDKIYIEKLDFVVFMKQDIVFEVLVEGVRKVAGSIPIIGFTFPEFWLLTDEVTSRLVSSCT